MSIRFLCRSIRLINIGNEFIKNSPSKIPFYSSQLYFSSISFPYIHTYKIHTTHVLADTICEDDKKRKTKIIPRITLINGDQLTVTTLEDGLKLAKRRDLKLVKIVDLDTKTQRPVYKLMTGSEYHAEDLKQREQKKINRQNNDIKGEKLLILNQNISENDLQTSVRKISKWIVKSYQVRVVINGENTNMDKAEKVYSFLENALKSEGRFLQKRQKGSDIKFQIYPSNKEKNKDVQETL